MVRVSWHPPRQDIPSPNYLVAGEPRVANRGRIRSSQLRYSAGRSARPHYVACQNVVRTSEDSAAHHARPTALPRRPDRAHPPTWYGGNQARALSIALDIFDYNFEESLTPATDKPDAAHPTREVTDETMSTPERDVPGPAPSPAKQAETETLWPHFRPGRL